MRTPEECRVLIIAPVGQDAEVMAGVLREHEIRSEVCAEPAECVRKIDPGAGALVLTEEALEMSGANQLLEHLRGQLVWSELPLIILTSGGESRRVRLLDLAISAAGSVSLLERPIAPTTLLRSVEVALRTRERQYQVRDLMAAQERQRLVLHESEAQLRAMFDVASVGKAHAELTTGRLLRVNAGLCQMTGYTEAELLARTLRDITHPEDRESDWIGFRRLAYGDVSGHENEKRCVRADGQVIWVQVSCNTIRDEAGRPICAAAIIQDMTERKNAEAALRESEERFRSLADGTPVLIWVHDAEGGLRFVNRAWTDFFGRTIDQATGNNWQPLMHLEDGQAYLERFFKCHAERREFQGQARVCRSDGQWRWLESFGAPRFSSSAEYLGMAGSSVDITDRKTAEAVLARDKEELERLVAQRTAKLKEMVDELEHFSYTITHDMRAPLRGMQGFAEMAAEAIANGPVEDARSLLDRIRTSGLRMDRLITDALNYSRAVRQEMLLELVDVGVLLHGMVDSYPELQKERAEIDLVSELPLVMGNEAGLTQCFSNLLGNALKFVKPGQKPKIRIWGEVLENRQEISRFSVQGPIAGVAGRTLGDRISNTEAVDGEVGAEGSDVNPAGPRWVRIWVEDHGIGMLKSLNGRLFDMFSRGQNSYEGTGIGLALVRKVAQQMGGSVGVESEEGQGCRFWIELRSGERGAKAQRLKR